MVLMIPGIWRGEMTEGLEAIFTTLLLQLGELVKQLEGLLKTRRESIRQNQVTEHRVESKASH